MANKQEGSGTLSGQSNTEALRREIAQLIEKRGQMSDKLAGSFINRTHSRAKTTTANAELGRISDRINELRQMLKQAEAA